MSTTTTIQSNPTQVALEAPRHVDTGSALNTLVDGSKPVRLHEVPTFQDKLEERKWAKKHMAATFRIFAKLGYADGASGHISLRGMCISRSHIRLKCCR